MDINFRNQNRKRKAKIDILGKAIDLSGNENAKTTKHSRKWGAKR